MTHVQIRSPHPEYGTGAIQVLLNGVDISFDVAAEDLTIHPPSFEDGDILPTVSLKIVCDDLDLDLPESVLNAIAVAKAGDPS